jgi:hypothetical protein
MLSQLDAITRDYFMMKGDKVLDLYTETSFFLDYFLKQKKGLWDTNPGGSYIEIPLRYDRNAGGFFQRGSVLDSTQRQTITAVKLPRKYIYGNGTIYQIDAWENQGAEKKVDMVMHETEGAQLALNEIMATSIFTGLEGDANNLTGFNAITDTTATTNYAGYCSNDIVSNDGTKVWTGLGSSSATQLSLSTIRTIRTAAAYGKGKTSEPDLIATTETNYNKIKTILDASQLMTEGVKTAKMGFSGVHFEGCDIYPDRYCPASNLYGFNSGHIGFNAGVLWKRMPWEIIAGSPGDKTLKIFFGGNIICDNRRSCIRYSSIS